MKYFQVALNILLLSPALGVVAQNSKPLHIQELQVVSLADVVTEDAGVDSSDVLNIDPPPTMSNKTNVIATPKARVDSTAVLNSDLPLSLFNETIPMLWASRLVYTFASLVQETREGNLKVPNATFNVLSTNDRVQLFPRSFRSINALIKENWKALTTLEKSNKGMFADFDYHLLQQLYRVEQKTPNDDMIWLEDFDSLYQDHQCVYGIVRDDINKRIIITFRGSVSEGTMDWARNFQVAMTHLRLPTMAKEVIKKRTGEDKDSVPVHAGFYAYLFDNDVLTDGAQKFDTIRHKLKTLYDVPEYKEYKLFVSGHSLGAALSSLIAFKLAGSDKEWIPKPVTCISFESPMNGGDEFRDAFQALEREGLIRYLRVTNQEDIVPAIPPFSLGWKFWAQKTYKHVGLQLNLRESDYEFVYPRDDNGFSRAVSNNFVTKKTWNVNKYHGLQLVHDRLDEHMEELSNTYIDEVYGDEKIVGDRFSRVGKDEL